MSDPFSSVEDELPRDRWGRPLITPPDGGTPRAYTRVTTLAGSVEDTYHLGQWQKRMVAVGMARRPDLVLGALGADPNDKNGKKTLNEIAKNALEASNASAAATTGTALHSLTERVDRNEDLGFVPPAYLPDLEAYRRIISENALETVVIEGFCVQDEIEVGGSYDRIFRVGRDIPFVYNGAQVSIPAGTHVIGDLKTGKSVDLGAGKISMQLGTYANSLNYSHRRGERTPLVPGHEVSKDWGLVIHLPAGSGAAQLVVFNIASGWEAVQELAVPVRAWRKRRDLIVPVASVHASTITLPTAASPQGVDTVLAEILAVTSMDSLNAVYFANMAVWSDAHNVAARAQKALIG
jgi:hypothetical protein